MTLFVGLDVSQKTTAICVVDDAGKIVRDRLTFRSTGRQWIEPAARLGTKSNLPVPTL